MQLQVGISLKVEERGRASFLAFQGELELDLVPDSDTDRTFPSAVSVAGNKHPLPVTNFRLT